MHAILFPLTFPLLVLATPSQYGALSLDARAIGDSCKAPEGAGTCKLKSKCPGISYSTNLCPKDPADVQCCVQIACTVPSVGSGLCRSRWNNGCAGGTFYSGLTLHSDFCPGPDDIQCCVRSGGKTSPGPSPTHRPSPTPRPVPPNPCTGAALDNLVFDAPMPDFLAAKQAKNPDCFDWSDDGCSCSPDKPEGFNFLPACYRHDFGYRNNKALGRFDAAMKERVDDNLHRDLYDICNKYAGWLAFEGVKCRRIADLYVVAVKKAPAKARRDAVAMAKSVTMLEKRDCDVIKKIMAKV
ncbi:MAG: hypothetical protein Q9213_007289 [Squamulea squamosa]